jgi:hypothetical protein
MASLDRLAELVRGFVDEVIDQNGNVAPAARQRGQMHVVRFAEASKAKSGGSEGLGFIVTIKSAQSLLVPRKVFWGALQGVLLIGRLATVFNVPAPAGFLVKTVAQRSTAWNMGLQGSDGTLTIGGKQIIPVGGDIILSGRLAARRPVLKMNVLRAGKVIELAGTSQ